jgi:hypothetical protein
MVGLGLCVRMIVQDIRPRNWVDDVGTEMLNICIQLFYAHTAHTLKILCGSLASAEIH